MCGILGWVGKGPDYPTLELDLLKHRGPDDRGLVLYRSRSGRVSSALGSTRLAILDLSEAGHMPMEHPDEPISIVFNGEVYNHSELRSQLESCGERFCSRTDTEVILRGYRVWGEAVVERLLGMFAFAVWDGRGDGRLLLARDRFGKKPVYFRKDGERGLYFASELKAILSQDKRREIDPDSLAYYLAHGYPPSDKCMLLGFRKVLPGHFMTWENGRLDEIRYWSAPAPADAINRMPIREAVDEFSAKLNNAVKTRLVADVPLGLLLSGGIDSASILSVMSRLSTEPVRSYTACFGAQDLDESEFARLSALGHGCRHRAIMINPRTGELLPFIASHMDEPIADPSAIATYLICQRARQEVTVLLSGDGSDELLLGYPRYKLHAASQLISRLPRGLRSAASRLFRDSSIPEKTLSAPESPLLRDYYWLNHAKDTTAAFNNDPNGRMSPAEAVSTVLKRDVETWLVEDVLTKVDKMSMAASVETRAPFLDPLLGDWVMRLSPFVRMSWFQGKRILRDSMKPYLPIEMVNRKKKAFLLPMDQWLRHEWRVLTQDILLDPATINRGWIAETEVRRILSEHFSGTGFHGRRIYQLLILELWARSILDKGRSEPIPSDAGSYFREIPSDRKMRKVFIVAPAGIGDTMRLTPGISHLGKIDPAVSVILCTNHGSGSDQVMAGKTPVDGNIAMDFRQRGFATGFRLLRLIRRESPDQLVSTLVSKPGILMGFSGVKDFRAWVPQWSTVFRLGSFYWKKKIAYDSLQKDVGRNDMVSFGRLLGFDALQNLSPAFSPPIWKERALKEAMAQLATLERPVLAVSVMAASDIPQREYPLKTMGLVLQELLGNKVANSLVILGDAACRDRLGELCLPPGLQCLNLSGELSLAATAEIMRNCDAGLVVDGGLLHVALSTELPIVALYGPTHIFDSDPRGNGNRYIALSAFDKCICGCKNHRGIKVHPDCMGPTCLSSIPPKDVVRAVEKILGNSRSDIQPEQRGFAGA